MFQVTQKKHKNSPAYEIKPENVKGRVRVVHRNLLLLCDFLAVEKVNSHADLGSKNRKTGVTNINKMSKGTVQRI